MVALKVVDGHCALCGTSTAKLRPWLAVPLDVKTREPIETGTLVWCDDCGLGTLRRQPSDYELSVSYQLPTYYTHGKSHMPQVAPGLPDRILTKLAYLRDCGHPTHASDLLKRRPDAGSVLDIGCGGGKFLASFDGNGRTLTGVEPDPVARETAALRGLEVLAGTAEDLPEQVRHRTFDLVTLTHVLEHCRDPLRVLRNVQGLLAPDGLFYCEVPNCNSIYFQTQAEISEMLDVPRHLHFFTKAALAGLCDKAGLRIVEWTYHGYTRHFGPAWRAWENDIHAMLSASGVQPGPPRRTWANSVSLIKASAFAEPDRKYDCIGFVARASEPVR